MTAQRNWGRWLTGFNVALTAAAIGTLALGAGLNRSRSSVFATSILQDYWVAIVLWSYIIVTPICGGLAIALRNKGNNWGRIDYLLLIIWLAFITWTGSMTL